MRFVPIFEPPTDDDVVFYDPFAPYLGAANRLGAHIVPSARGRNVWKKTDGTFTESQPEAKDVVKVFFGGHLNEITAAEQAELTAAGYGVYITG